MTIARLPALVGFLVCQARASVSVAVRVSHHYFVHALEMYLYNLLYSYACTALWGLVIDGMRFINVIYLLLRTTQLRFYMVSPQLVLLIILTMQSYKFYKRRR